MEYRPLGRTELKVSVICLGTMTFGEQNTEAEGHEQLDYAIAHGVNFIDTAELYSIPPRAETYGRTEEIIGSWLQKRGRRDDLILASKIAGPGEGWIDHIRHGVCHYNRRRYLNQYAHFDFRIKRLPLSVQRICRFLQHPLCFDDFITT